MRPSGRSPQLSVAAAVAFIAVLAIAAAAVWWLSPGPEGSLDAASGVPTRLSASDVKVEPTENGATVTWTTSEPANSQVRYGVTTAYDLATSVEENLVTSHTVALTGLASGQKYHLRAISKNANGAEAPTSDTSFVTPGVGGGTGPGTTLRTGANAHSVAIADLDRDGRNDLVVASTGSNTVSVLLGSGKGAFRPAVSYAVGREPKSAVLVDVNGDKKLDIITSNQGSSSISVLLGIGTGAFQRAAEFPACASAHESAVADLNGDGKPDVVCVGWGAPAVAVLPGDGNGGFLPRIEYPVQDAPHSVVVADLNGDGTLDVAVANHDSNSASVLLGAPGGTLRAAVNYPAGQGPHSLRAADLNRDGRLDLVTANDASDDVSVLLGIADGRFAATTRFATGRTPKSVALADVDGDGVVDILVASINGNYPAPTNAAGGGVSVLLGQGDGTFKPSVEFPLGRAPFSVAVGDLNGGAVPDVAVADWWAGGVLLRLDLRP